MIAKRLRYFDSSAVRHSFELAAESPNLIDLSIGYPEDNTPDYIKAAGIKAISDNFTQYTPSNGMFELRVAVGAKLQRENKIMTDPDRISITPGVTTGILLSYMSILDPGDEILVPQPYFPPYKDVAIMLGAKPVMIDTFPHFQLTADLIKPMITSKTKALVINSPNNPSGAVYPEAELRKIAQLAKQHDIIIISDEVYEYFAYDVPHFSIGSIYDKTITLNGFSKAYAMTGWRIGYVTGPAEIIEAINSLQQYLVFSSSSIGQKAALAAFKYSPSKLTAKYKSKRDLTRKALSGIFKLHGAQGAFYAFLRLPDGCEDRQFVGLAAQRGLIILPGSVFSGYHDYVRLAFAADRPTLAKGLRIVKDLAHDIKTLRTGAPALKEYKISN